MNNWGIRKNLILQVKIQLWEVFIRKIKGSRKC